MEISPWLVCQVAAVFAAAWLFVRTTRGERFAVRAAFLRALPFTVVGALGVDYALRLLGYLGSGARGAAPAFGGIMAYGALFGLGGAFAFFGKRAGMSTYRALDRITAPLALLVCIGRVGCALAGCEHGKATGGSFGVTYPASHPHFDTFVHDGVANASAAATERLHPATLYEAAFALAACLFALFLLPRKTTRPGGVFFGGTLVYAGGRIVSEAFRGDAARGDLGGAFTIGQAMSVFAIGLAFSLALRETEPKRETNDGDGGRSLHRHDADEDENEPIGQTPPDDGASLRAGVRLGA